MNSNDLKGSKKIEILGFFSGLITTLSFIPQIFSIWIKFPKPAEDISLWMYLIFSVGIIGWLIYGIKIKKMPVVVWNSITLCLAISIIVYKIIYG